MSGKDLSDEVLRRMAAMSGSDRAYFGNRAEMEAGTAIYVGLSDLASALLEAREALLAARNVVSVCAEHGEELYADMKRGVVAQIDACLPDPRADEVGGKANA